MSFLKTILVVSCTHNVSEISVPKFNISDHYPTGITWKIKSSSRLLNRNNHCTIKYRKQPDFDILKILVFDKIYKLEDTNDLDKKLKNFNDALISSLESMAPVIVKRVKRTSQPPWFSEHICKAIQAREHSKLKGQTRDFKYWRNKVCSLIRSEKQNYYKSLMKESQGNTSKVWKCFNEITGRIKVHDSITSLYKENYFINDKTLIGNAFNDYFSKVALIARSTLPNNKYETSDEFINYVKSKNIIMDDFSISPISLSEVAKWLSTLDTKKATGHDGISACLLRSISPVIINKLCETVNMSISSGKFPAIWKKALVKPLHKSGPTDLVNNYRPISILCVASKLLEFHVHKCLYRYICDKDILCSNQSGFRKYHSCLTCLTNMVESWYFAINEGNIVGSVELDFSKAFDILDHEILLNKLKFYGCDSMIPCGEWGHKAKHHSNYY